MIQKDYTGFKDYSLQRKALIDKMIRETVATEEVS
jgi:hypothetical protein